MMFLFLFQNPDRKLKSIVKQYKKEIYGHGKKEENNINQKKSSNNGFLGNGFIPTPKPRRRRKLVSANKEADNDDKTQDDMESEYYQDPHVSFVVKAVSALTAAFRLVQLERCVGKLDGTL